MLFHKMSQALLLDTTSSTGFLALLKDGKVIKCITFNEPRLLSKNLLPSIQALGEADLNSLCYIALGIGPGSYTGTRVGATVAQALRFALHIPLVTFSSTLLPDLEEIGLFVHTQFLQNQFTSQIDLVYFSQSQ